MEFKTIIQHAQLIRTKGSFKPFFKHRINDNYFDKRTRISYESDLHQRIFQSESAIVIRDNEYPFTFGKGFNQKVIWINKDVEHSIETIESHIKKAYEEFDYVVFLNKEQHRSIQSIPHYHAILSPITKESKLNKLIIFVHTHTEFLETKYDQKTKFFTEELIKIYSLDKGFSNQTFLSDPFDLCVKTLEIIMKIFNSNQEIIKMEICLENKLFEELDSTNEFDSLLAIATPLINRLNSIFHLESSYRGNSLLIELYNFYSMVKSNIGTDFISVLSEDDISQLFQITTQIQNKIYDHYQLIAKEYLIEIVDYVKKIDSELVIYSTHSAQIFLLARYFGKIYSNDFDYELPNYLSNIRIEEWDDSSTRIFYDNLLINN